MVSATKSQATPHLSSEIRVLLREDVDLMAAEEVPILNNHPKW